MYRAMIVEDEKIIREGISNLIKRFGNRIQVCWECENAAEAWRRFQIEKPDVVITDIIMRGKTGLELIADIRKVDAEIPVVILSGYSEFEYAQAAVRYNAFEYLLKPINVKEFAQMLERVEHLLDKRSGGAQASTERSERQVIQKIKDYVKEHVGEDLSLTTVARQTNLSTNYLSNLFRTETSQKYSDYVTNVRIEKAKQLLQDSELMVYEVAEICGYNSTKHFISVFKKHTGMAPLQYRKQGSE